MENTFDSKIEETRRRRKIYDNYERYAKGAAVWRSAWYLAVLAEVAMVL